jgi:pimeloyl-ACP methyl ester carboxylesterase
MRPPGRPAGESRSAESEGTPVSKPPYGGRSLLGPPATPRPARRSLGPWATRALRVIGVLLMLTALALALSRAPDLAVQGLVARWAPPPSDFIDIDGQLVHLRDEGPRDDPMPVLLLHGTGSSLHTWEGWAHVLQAQRRVITVDLPGNGLTGPNRDDDYHAETIARFVLVLMDRLQVARFVVGGNSMGGDVAWRVALLAPQRVDRLILVDASGPAFEPQSVPLGFLLARLPLLGKAGDYVLPREIVAASLENLYGDPARVTSAQVDRSFELTRREGNRQALRQRLAQMADEQSGSGDVPGRLAAITAPTLVLWGGRDRLIPPAVAQVFVRAIPGSRLVEFPALGHLPQEEDPAATVQPVKAFLGLK